MTEELITEDQDQEIEEDQVQVHTNKEEEEVHLMTTEEVIQNLILDLFKFYSIKKLFLSFLCS